MAIANLFDAGQLAQLNSIAQQNNQAAQQSIRNISQQYQPMDPAFLTQQLGPTGNLGSTPAFGMDGLSSMTPETFQAMMKNQVPLDQQISNAIKIRELQTGNPELRRSMYDSANRLETAQNHNLGTAVQGSQFNQSQMQQADQFKQRQALDELQFGEAQRSNKAAERHRAEQLKLESTRTRYAKEALADQLAGGVPKGTTNDDGLAQRLDVQLTQLGAIDPKKPGSFALGKVAEVQRPMAFQLYMQREAAKGLPFTTQYDVPEASRQYLGGYPKVILGPGGWHGVFNQNGKNMVTDTPVVPFRSTPTKNSGSAGSTGTVQNVYGQ